MAKIPQRITLTDKMKFDIHCHIFNRTNVPDGFVGIRLPWTRKFFDFLENAARFIGKLFGNKEISNAKYFVDLFNKSVPEITEQLMSYYSEDTIFCPLLMDMAPSIKGKIQENYQSQIDEMTRIVNKYPGRILPFLAMNPLNPHMKNIFDNNFTKDTFIGVKIYPSLGYLPSHPTLMKIFEECEIKGIPVTVHCSKATVHTTKHKFDSIPYIVMGPDGMPMLKEEKNKWFWTKNDYSWFNEPRHWEPVLQFFPKLRLNLAHFGGYEEMDKFFKGDDTSWVHRIISLMQRYPNVYTDIAYSLFRTKFYPNFRKLLTTNELVLNRMMYGSDYYMVVLEGHFRGIKTGFEVAMGSEIMATISQNNPRNFLFGN